tara:strand:- start:351 stop:578 length:228 start_codon:yes stop_codon:yes gene_type:complete
MKFSAVLLLVATVQGVSLEKGPWGQGPTRIWLDGPGFPNDPNQRAAEASQASQEDFRARRSVFEAYGQRSAPNSQ